MRSHKVAATRGARFFEKVVVPIIEFVLAFGSAVIAYSGGIGKAYSGVLGMGVSPASNLTTNLPQSLVTQYDATFIENLKGNTPWLRCVSRRNFDENQGNKLGLFMYDPNVPPPNGSPGVMPTMAVEGTIGTGLTVSVRANVTTIGAYSDFMNVSRYALQTAIDNVIEGMGTQLGYRLAQIINIILQNTADGSTDPLAGHLSKDATSPVVTTDITAAAQSLAGVNARPFSNGRYAGIMSPLTVGDVLSDKNNNSLVDVVKRGADGNERLADMPSSDGEAVPVIDWGGVTFYQSTFVRTTPDYDAGTGTALRTYILGQDAVIALSLGAKENTQIGDGDWRNLKVYMKRITDPSGYDPAGAIGGFASYYTNFAATLPPDPVARMRWIDAVSAIT
jgi:hypothetical protein